MGEAPWYDIVWFNFSFIQCTKRKDKFIDGTSFFSLLLDTVVKTVNDQRRNVVFLLWGKDAQNRGALINKVRHIVQRSLGMRVTP